MNVFGNIVYVYIYIYAFVCVSYSVMSDSFVTVDYTLPDSSVQVIL